LSISTHKNETEIQLKYKGQKHAFKVPFIDRASIENAISCATCGIYLKLASASFFKSFEQLSPVAMRLELKEGINQCSLINDSYNSDLGSLKIALDFLKQQQQHNKKTLILSDILQSGMSEKSLLDEVFQIIKNSKLQKFIGIGPALFLNQKEFEKLNAEKYFFENTDQFLDQIRQLQFYEEEMGLVESIIHQYNQNQ
jgi:alanine racemase